MLEYGVCARKGIILLIGDAGGEDHPVAESLVDEPGRKWRSIG